VLLLLAGGMAAATATQPSATAPGPVAPSSPAEQVAVARAGAACPDPVVAEGTVTRVALAAPGPLTGGEAGGADATDGPGRATLEPATSGSSPVVRLAAPGSITEEAAAEDGPLVARATGRSAPGLAASQLTRSSQVAMRGLAGTTCATSGTDFWFVGSGAVVGQRGRVYLTNSEPAPAVVDVTLYGPDGPIDAPDGRGVTVAAGKQQVRLLDALAPGTERFAVHVHARQGRISAAVRDQQVDGLTPLGADWVPVATPPASRVLVPGVPGGTGERRLQVVAPGDADGIVRVRLVSESGAFAPAGLDVIEVRAGSVNDVDLAPYTDGEPVTVELQSDVPVTAGVLTRATGTDGQLAEIAYSAASDPLTPQTPGVVAEVRQGENLTSTLLLTAPAGPAVVELTPLPPVGGDPTEVRVSAGSQVAVALDSVSSAEIFSLAVVPAPGSGPVLAVRQVDEVTTDGPLLTSSPVPPGRYAVAVPRVVADLSTGLRAGR
ncbi:MAG TPA: DUF5719 family protein, partial [Actinomycetes bacterium]